MTATRFLASVIITVPLLIIVMSGAAEADGAAVADGSAVAPSRPVMIMRGQPAEGRVLEIPRNYQAVRVQTLEINTDERYVELTITATDSSGRYVGGLDTDDLRVYMGGRSNPVKFCRSDSKTPVSIGILVDTSNSMESKMSQARVAVTQFIDDLNPADDILLLSFSDHPVLISALTTDHHAVINRLSMLRPHETTALFDAIVEGLTLLNDGCNEKKALMVITDGVDTCSKAGLEQVVKQARLDKVLVYSIGIGDPNSNELDATTLKALSEETGAKAFLIGKLDERNLIHEATLAISEELRRQYTIGFMAPREAGDAALRVEVAGHPEVKVRVRKQLPGYHGNAPETPDHAAQPRLSEAPGKTKCRD